MGLLTIFKRTSRPSADDISVLSAIKGPTIDRSDVDLIKGLLEPLPVRETLNDDLGIRSLSVPRTKLREMLLRERSVRTAFRTLPIQVQDIQATAAKLAAPMAAAAYVKDTKYNKLAFSSSESLIPFSVQMRAIEDWAGDWGYVRIPAIILISIAAGVCWGAWKLATYSSRLLEDQNQMLVDAASSEKGLDRAVKARSGSAATPQTTAVSTSR